VSGRHERRADAVADIQSGDLIAALDEASLSWYHLRAVVASGVGFFTDAYDLFVIGIASALITKDWNLSPGQLAVLNSTILAAAFGGAMVFGRYADLVGRKRVNWLVALIGFRFLLGLGVGGDYPVSAVMVSEYANRKDRGRQVALRRHAWR
jgi:MFS family permease